MSDKTKQTDVGAIELAEDDLKKAQGGFAKPAGAVGEAMKNKAPRTGQLTDDGGFITPFE